MTTSHYWTVMMISQKKKEIRLVSDAPLEIFVTVVKKNGLLLEMEVATMDQNAASAKIHFIMFVCFFSKTKCIA
jgi:hypothetical protein